MSENTPIMKSIRHSTSRNFQKTIDLFRMYGTANTYRIICTFILIGLLIPSATATITQWQITPENPVIGDVVAVTGHASPSETIHARAFFTDSVSPTLKDGKMRYEYLIRHVKIPDGTNKFTVNANGVKDINIKVQLYGLPVWTPSLGNDGSGGKATISQSNVPGGTHNIKIYGIAADDASTVTLEIVAQQPITADSSGKFEYNYDSSSMSGVTAKTQLSVTMNNKGPIEYPDTISPSLSISNPADGATVTTSPVTISGTASDNSAVANIKVNGITATGTTTWNVGVTLTEGSNTITAVATDTSDNTGTNTITITYTPTATTTIINATTNATIERKGDDDARSSSGELLKNIVVTEKYSKQVFADKLAVYTFHESSNPISSIKVMPLNDQTMPMLVEVLKGVSTQVKAPTPNIAYRYLNIEAETPDIANATVAFSVNLDWIANNNIDSNSIMLMHYNTRSEHWDAISTKKGDEDDTKILYQAYITEPEFSPFAIVGKFNTTGAPVKSDQMQPTQKTSPETPAAPTKVASARYISVTIFAIFGFIYILRRKI